MRCILLLLMRIARVRRRIVGRHPPHWFKDATGLISYINVITLLPTFAAIFLDPDHFFRRLPQYIKNKNSWVMTPLKFFTCSLTLLSTVIFFFANDILMESGLTERDIYWYLFVTTISVPILVPLLCIFLFPLFILAKILPDMAPDWIQWELLMPLALSTYTRSNVSHFGWGALYVGVFFWISMHFLAVFGALEIWILNIWLSRHFWLFVIPPAALLAALFVFVAYIVFLRPYIALLRESNKLPTKNMLRSEGYLLKQAIQGCELHVETAQWEALKEYLPSLQSLVYGYEMIANDQNMRIKSASQEYQYILSRERAQVWGKMFCTTRLRLLLAQNTDNNGVVELDGLIARIENIVKGQI